MPNDLESSPTAGAGYLGTLPIVAFTKGGAEFAPRDEVWPIDEPHMKVVLNFGTLPLSLNLSHTLKVVLVWYSREFSLAHLQNVFTHLRRFFLSRMSASPIDSISVLDILNYRALMGVEKQWYLGSFSAVLKKWVDLGLPGVAPTVKQLLSELTFPGNPKGIATLTMDPRHGPLSPVELEGLQLALNDAHSRGKVTEAKYVLSWLFFALGQRPKQYCALKVCDVKREFLPNGAVQYVIRIPRAKQSGESIRPAFKERILSSEIGALTYNYAKSVEASFFGTLPHPEAAPLFPALANGSTFPGYEHHMSSLAVAQLFNSTVRRLGVKSERTGELLYLYPTRFRRTIGTRARDAGHGDLVIAELLDHSDTQSVKVYVGTTTAMIRRIDRALAMQLGSFAQAFVGKLIGDKSSASRAYDPNNVIRAPSIIDSAEEISSCCADNRCAFVKPIACYTCNSFEPWADGPHEQVMVFLLADRERLLETADITIASINDRTILAVAEVIQLCQAFNEKEDS